jgi:hypothetical protein
MLTGPVMEAMSLPLLTARKHVCARVKDLSDFFVKYVAEMNI